MPMGKRRIAAIFFSANRIFWVVQSYSERKRGDKWRTEWSKKGRHVDECHKRYTFGDPISEKGVKKENTLERKQK